MRDIIVTRSFGLGNAVQAIPALRRLQEQKRDFLVAIESDAARDLLAPEFPVVDVRERKGKLLCKTWIDLFPAGGVKADAFGEKAYNSTPSPKCWSMNEVEANVNIVNAFLRHWRPAPSCELIPQGKERKARMEPGLIGFHPGCQAGDNGVWLRKRWPVMNWVMLANNLMDKGKRIVMFGHKPDDRQVLAKLYDELGITVEWAVDLPVRQAAFKAGACEWFISNDSGMAHLALAGGCKKVVILYGPTVPTKNTHDGALAVVNAGACPHQPCYSDRFSVEGKRCTDNLCMRVIEPGQVMGVLGV